MTFDIPNAVYYIVLAVAIIAVNVYETRSLKRQINGVAKNLREEIDGHIETRIQVAILKERIEQRDKK